MTTLENTDVAVLCGGKATRLGNLATKTPKALQKIAGKPFLDYLVAWLESYGAKKIFLLAGHLHQPLVDWLQDRGESEATIELHIEEKKLGTAGAVRRILPRVKQEKLLICNGDTMTTAGLTEFFMRAPDDKIAELHCRRFGSENTFHAGFTLIPRKYFDTLAVPGEEDLTTWLRWKAERVLMSGDVYLDIGTALQLKRAQKLFPRWGF